MSAYSVWMEGYSATGDYAPAHCVGHTNAESFRDACVKLLKDDTSFNEERLTVWGCRLFTNEAEARESFG